MKELHIIRFCPKYCLAVFGGLFIMIGLSIMVINKAIYPLLPNYYCWLAVIYGMLSFLIALANLEIVRKEIDTD